MRNLLKVLLVQFAIKYLAFNYMALIIDGCVLLNCICNILQ